jgi:hypothetical protein
VAAAPVIKRRMPCICSPITSFLPPSYTHRHCCELARAPGGSCAGGPFPPRPFVWEIPKIDCRHTNGPRPTHADFCHCHAWENASWDRLGGACSHRGPGRQEVRVQFGDLPYSPHSFGDLPYRPHQNLVTYPIGGTTQIQSHTLYTLPTYRLVLGIT